MKEYVEVYAIKVTKEKVEDVLQEYASIFSRFFKGLLNIFSKIFSKNTMSQDSYVKLDLNSMFVKNLELVESLQLSQTSKQTMIKVIADLFLSFAFDYSSLELVSNEMLIRAYLVSLFIRPYIDKAGTSTEITLKSQM